MKKIIRSTLKNSVVLFAVSLATSPYVQAQGTGSFDINSTDFKALFNKARFGQPQIVPWPGSYWSYGTHGTAAKTMSGRFSGRGGRAPMEVFDAIAGQTGAASALKWEKENHTCDIVDDKETKAGCMSWWGHCNGWSAAAIKEFEPRKEFKVGSATLTVADAKGILSEVWMSSDSLFAGETDKEAKVRDGLKAGGWIDKPGNETYEQFWDVSPRTFFLIMTNYTGIARSGVVIDRFSGDEVWNQPIVGYRNLPIDKNLIRQEAQNGRQLWAVPMKMKLYWANDLDTPPGIVSMGFDIAKDSNDSAQMEHSLPTGTLGELAYESRLLEFTLFFDKEVKVSDDGLQVLSAGRIVGEGIWKMQERPRDYGDDQLVNSHPDFVWMPTNWLLDTSNGYGNPYLNTRAVAAVSRGNAAANAPGAAPVADAPVEAGAPPAARPATSIAMDFAPSAFENLASVTSESVRRKLRRVFSRGGYKVSMRAEGVSISGATVGIIVEFPDGINEAELKTFLTDAEMEVVSLKAVSVN